MSGERERDLQDQVEALTAELDNAHTAIGSMTETSEIIQALLDREVWRGSALRALLREAAEALRTHIGWIDSERTGPDYGTLTRDTHPRGEEIWSAWWQGQLDQCSLTEARTRAVLAKLEARDAPDE